MGPTLDLCSSPAAGGSAGDVNKQGETTAGAVRCGGSERVEM